MNRTYRLIWNQVVQSWVVAPETAKSSSKGGKGSKLKAAAVAVASLASFAALNAYALPTGGQVNAGSGTISQGGCTLTVNQSSENLSVNWNTFNIGSSETVNFVQPGKSSIALNRVLGSDASAIYGKLNANGQVFLVNSNGILFAKGAQVNVGGLVASTQNITDADFLNHHFHFTGTAGSVVNQGTIAGDYVALLGGQVSNQGSIMAKLGTVALAAGSDITLDFAGDGLIGVQVSQGTLNALAENQQLIQADGGTVVLTAKAANSLISAVVNNSGVIEATSVASQGGTIELLGDASAGIAENSGTVTGNEVDVSARSVLQSGAVNATTANLTANYALIQTDGASVTGKSVTVNGGENTYISGALTGMNNLTVAGQSVTLAGASLATGENGSIRVGGGEHGQDADITNAQTVSVSGATTIKGGSGAHVTVWSDGTTNYFGNTTAGTNSFVEVSSKGTLNLGGLVTVAAGGHILYDPANIVIDASPTSSMFYLSLTDPSTTAGNKDGTGGVTALTNGNIVVDSYLDNFGGSNAGAVYLYNGKTGALISTLTGSHASDYLGIDGVTVLANGNFVVASASWNGNVGAVTWGSGTSGVSGVVSSTNSLVGSAGGNTPDAVGEYGVTALANGNYVVRSADWSDGAGAVTWGSGTSGVSGVVSSANSLVGSTAGDAIGQQDVTVLANGNYVVDSDAWNGNMGAVTWGSGTSGVTGVVSSANSLVGSTTDDFVGSSIVVLTNGNYVVGSDNWNGNKGAVTWGSGTSGVSGVVSSANSLVGASANDQVGYSGVKALTNGNYVVSSDVWNGNMGAATWGSGTSGVSGVVSSANSLVGSVAGDRVGSVVTALSNGNYVVSGTSWSGNKGAVTWGNGTSGVSGVVSSANSLVGSATSDHVGASITALANGNYVVDSYNWNGNMGAVTLGSGTSGVTGVVSSANSLVGSTGGSNGDEVGVGGVKVLTNGNYVVDSYDWGGNKGAVTWGSATAGVVGVVSSANSLVGSTANDEVGHTGITVLANGNYVVDSYNWNGNKGAVTWGSGTSGVTGVVSSANSLVGSAAGDYVGYRGVTALANGNYVVDSDVWNGNKGAVTWGSGTSGVSGVVSSANSLVGSTAGDEVGSYLIRVLSNGNYVVDSDAWNGNMGAVTWGSGTSGVTGIVSSANSLVGSTAGDYVGVRGVTALANGNYVVDSPFWDGGSSNGRGAVTWGSGTSGVTGVVSSSNSLVGSTAGDEVGSVAITVLANGDYVVGSSAWNGGMGAVTWGSGTSGVMGVVSSANSLVGSSIGDGVGGHGGGVTALANGNYVIDSPTYNNNAGAVWLVADPSNLGSLASSSAADVTVSPTQLAVADGAGASVTLAATNDVTVNSAVSVAGQLNLVAGNTVTLNAGLTSTASGTALVVAGTDFVNNAGSNALSTPNGRWLVYAAGPTGNTAGGLTSGGADVYGTTYSSSGAASIASGSHFVYASASGTPSGSSGLPPASSGSASGSWNGADTRSDSAYAGALASAQTFVPGMGSVGAGGAVLPGTLAQGDDFSQGSAGNGNSSGNPQSLTAGGVIDSGSNFTPATVTGLTLIDTGIRLPEGLRNAN